MFLSSRSCSSANISGQEQHIESPKRRSCGHLRSSRHDLGRDEFRPARGWASMPAIFIVIALLSLPNLGVATVIALVIMGQTVGSIIFDHFGLSGLRNVDFPSWLGALLLVVGVCLVRRRYRDSSWRTNHRSDQK